MKKSVFKTTAAAAFAAVLLSSCDSMTDNNITDEQGREMVVLARNEADEFSSKSINLLIKEYNNSDRKFYIEEKKYLSSDNLLVDIIGGENIDVLFVNGWIDTTPLYAKGVICDLYEFIDNDSDVSRDTYVEPVLKALEKDGKLYEIPYDFYVESAIVKTDLWGDDNDTSFEHITEKSKSLGCEIPYDLSFDSYAFISYIISEYVDLTNSSCSFDGGKFEEYIKFMKQYYNSIQKLSNEEIYNKFKNDELLVMSCGFAGFDQIEFTERDVSDKIKFIGFPSETKNYHIAVPTTSLSVFTKSKNQTGAFDFIKYCTSYEAYVDNTDGTERITHSHALPINRDALDFHYNWSIETNVLEIDENTKRSYCDEIMKQISSVNGSGNMTCNAIGDILSEELTSYFNGDKEPDEVCRIIQSRVTIYLSEQS